MRVVSNTSPICNLAIINRLYLLKQRYGFVYIPPAVFGELSRLSHIEAKHRIETAVDSGWIFVQGLPVELPVAVESLDAGETEAIILAEILSADLLLMDEKLGRAAARSRNLTVSGVLGELLYAKLTGEIPTLKLELQLLRMKAGFFIDSGIEKFLLSEAGE